MTADPINFARVKVIEFYQVTVGPLYAMVLAVIGLEAT